MLTVYTQVWLVAITMLWRAGSSVVVGMVTWQRTADIAMFIVDALHVGLDDADCFARWMP